MNNQKIKTIIKTSQDKNANIGSISQFDIFNSIWLNISLPVNGFKLLNEEEMKAIIADSQSTADQTTKILEINKIKLYNLCLNVREFTCAWLTNKG